MAIDLEYTQLKEYFRNGIANVSLSEDHSILIVLSSQVKHWFRIPPMLEANNKRLPGWFTAGIWDIMQMRSINELPDSMWLQGWGFTHDANVWRLSINGVQQLVYNPDNNRLCIQNFSVGSTTEVGTFPIKFIFHAQKLFEENGWFNGETQVESLDIRDYLVE